MLVGYEALRKLKITREDMLIRLIFEVFLLLILFVFIFIGIRAFSFVNSFGSVINSILPVAAGYGIAAKSKDQEKETIK